MFTQCSKCETVFKLSAEVLRTAGGQVRCGRCGEVFNALTRLAEDPSAFTVGESPLELEARADQILRTAADAPAPTTTPTDESGEYASLEMPGVQIARLEVQELRDDEPRARGAAAHVEPEGAEQSLEFTLPPGELDRIFVEAKSPGHAAAPPAAGAAGESPDSEIGAEVSEAARRDILESLGAVAAPALGGDRRSTALWLAAGILLALLLGAQIVHRNREWLAAREPFGGTLRALYARLGDPLPMPANLSGYQLRQWGVTGDPAANGTLRVRASILNTTAQLQPFPLLRVTLADRFGARIGARDFEPAEYLGKPAARLLTPGERADATIEILDPGKNAEGFEIDVCLRGAGRRVTCANDAAAHAR